MSRQVPADFFDARFNALVHDGGLDLVHVVTEGGSHVGSGMITMMHYPRMLVCIAGTGHYQILRNSEPQELTLHPRQGIYLSPGSWICNCARKSYESLGLCMLPSFTRYLAVRFDAAKQSVNQLEPWAWHHAQGVAEVDMNNFCDALARGAGRPPDDPYLCHLFNLLVLTGREILSTDGSHPQQRSPSEGKAYVTWQAASQYVMEHCHQPTLCRTDVADYLGIHPNHISRLFATFSNESFTAFLHRSRLELATNLLANSNLNVAEVAQLSGFSEASYFIRLFRRHFRITPSKYRAASL